MMTSLNTWLRNIKIKYFKNNNSYLLNLWKSSDIDKNTSNNDTSDMFKSDSWSKLSSKSVDKIFKFITINKIIIILLILFLLYYLNVLSPLWYFTKLAIFKCWEIAQLTAGNVITLISIILSYMAKTLYYFFKPVESFITTILKMLSWRNIKKIFKQYKTTLYLKFINKNSLKTKNEHVNLSTLLRLNISRYYTKDIDINLYINNKIKLILKSIYNLNNINYTNNTTISTINNLNLINNNILDKNIYINIIKKINFNELNLISLTEINKQDVTIIKSDINNILFKNLKIIEYFKWLYKYNVVHTKSLTEGESINLKLYSLGNYLNDVKNVYSNFLTNFYTKSIELKTYIWDKFNTAQSYNFKNYLQFKDWIDVYIFLSKTFFWIFNKLKEVSDWLTEEPIPFEKKYAYNILESDYKNEDVLAFQKQIQKEAMIDILKHDKKKITIYHLHQKIKINDKIEYKDYSDLKHVVNKKY